LKTQTFSILLIGFVLSGLSVAETPLIPTPDAISQKAVGPKQPDKQPAKIIFPIIPVLDEEQAEQEDLLPPVPKPPRNNLSGSVRLLHGLSVTCGVRTISMRLRNA